MSEPLAQSRYDQVGSASRAHALFEQRNRSVLNLIIPPHNASITPVALLGLSDMYIRWLTPSVSAVQACTQA